MAVRPMQRVMTEILQQRGRGAVLRTKLARNKERNWLLAVMLNSFARFADGAKLTDLEQTVVTAFQRNGFSDAELKEKGRTAQQMPQAVRDELFPPAFARLDPKTPYSFAQLDKDAQPIVDAVLAAPTVTNVDIHAVHAGRAALADFAMPRRSVLADRASGMLVATAENRTASTSRYRIKATSFHCNDRATDSFFGPSNEAYWIFGSLGGGTAITTRSQVFGDVDGGETRSFGSSEGCIWGQNCTAQQLPDGEIGSLVQLWEHDEGDPDEIQAGVAAAFAAAAGILAATGVAAWVGAVVAGVGAAIQWLLGFLDDDHIADQTFVFTRQALEDQLSKAGQSFVISRRFTDGDGDYSLVLNASRTA